MTNYETMMNRDSSSTAVQWSWWLLMMLAASVLFSMYGPLFDIYEIGIVIFTAAGMALLGQNWPGFRIHIVAVTALSLIAIKLYGADLAAPETSFFLNSI